MAIAKESTVAQLPKARPSQHKARSAARASAAFTDALSFTELWADFNAWSSTTLVLSNGTVRGNSLGGGSGINHSFTVKPSETARIVSSVTVSADQGSSRIIVGVSNDVAGAAPVSGGSSARGISFTGTEVRSWGTTETALGAVTAGTWVITITVDKTNISCVAVRYDGNVEYRTSFPRSSFTVNNIYVFNSTSTGNTSAYINALGARKGITTLAPRAGIEGQERTVQWSTVPDGVNAARIALPANYDSRVPTPLVIAAHGHGATAAMFADDSHGKLMANAFLAAGYIVASTVGNATGTEFGSNKLINSQAALYKYVRDHYNIDGVFLYGISMGGLGSLLSAVDERIPDVRAWCGSSPICSLSWAYEQAGWTTEIKTEYGIASDGSDYASKTAGNDPLLKPEAFAGLPMFFVSSPADTVVTKANNADQLAAAVGPYAAEVKTYTAAGQHNDPSQYPASDIVAFFDRFA